MIALGSLFSGIGGLERGLERAIPGARTRWQVEIDPFCNRVLERHWPHAKRWKDVRDFATHLETYGSARRVGAVEVICGGFPCQDLSVAGNGAGLDGARSGLFFDALRVVRALRPRVVVLENVSALLARGLGRVLGELAACGYDAEWDCVPASAVGAPHRRDRIFIVAHAVGDVVRDEPGRRERARWRADAGIARDVGALGEAADADCGRLESERGPDAQPQLSPGCELDGRRGAGADVADADGSPRGRQARDAVDGDGDEAMGEWASEPRRRGHAADAERAPREGGCAPGRVQPQHADAHGFRPRPLAWGQPPPSIRRVDDGLPARVDGPRRRRPANDKHRLRALGNAVVPAVAEVIGARVAGLLGAA
jgi:DNA (cytosine-5)-methyltransferase 1